MLPKHIPVLAVGGVTPYNFQAFVAAGTAGFGIGGSLYKPGDDGDGRCKGAAVHRGDADPLDVLRF